LEQSRFSQEPDVEARTSIVAAMHFIGAAIELIGVSIIVAAAALSTVLFIRQCFYLEWEEAYRWYRANLGRGILLGLEFLVAADIIGTVAVTPTFGSLGVLALIIVIRTALSFTLQVEIEGQLPWRRQQASLKPALMDQSG
jgi:uncharacterized membrane protein